MTIFKELGIHVIRSGKLVLLMSTNNYSAKCRFSCLVRGEECDEPHWKRRYIPVREIGSPVIFNFPSVKLGIAWSYVVFSLTLVAASFTKAYPPVQLATT